MNTEQAEKNTHRQQQQIELLTERVRLLEEQNHRLANLLREHGIKVREHTGMAMELPPPVTEPLDERERAHLIAEMADPERILAEEHLGEEPVYHAVRSETGVDVGQWFGVGTVWVLALNDEMLLFAAGKRPFVERVPYAEVQKSIYNHVTGEVVLAPGHGLRVERIAVPPSEGYQLLAQIYVNKEETNEETQNA